MAWKQSEKFRILEVWPSTARQCNLESANICLVCQILGHGLPSQCYVQQENILLISQMSARPSFWNAVVEANMGLKKGFAESAQGIYGPERKHHRSFRRQRHFGSFLSVFCLSRLSLSLYPLLSLVLPNHSKTPSRFSRSVTSHLCLGFRTDSRTRPCRLTDSKVKLKLYARKTRKGKS